MAVVECCVLVHLKVSAVHHPHILLQNQLVKVTLKCSQLEVFTFVVG